MPQIAGACPAPSRTMVIELTTTHEIWTAAIARKTIYEGLAEVHRHALALLTKVIPDFVTTIANFADPEETAQFVNLVVGSILHHLDARMTWVGAATIAVVDIHHQHSLDDRTI